ncbi:MAG: sigma-54 dependent transcriptional regulator [Acidobacteria bacterium]|nr:sigma-54 dependent transcriptional regulator [Acidobacteriota bacterium]
MTHPTIDIRVLLVDDDAAFRRAMGGELARRGYRVDTRTSGRDTMDPAASADVDVILLDLRLPDIDGLEVLRDLRARNVPAGIVVLTGHGTIDTAVKAIQMGAHDYLEKPCPIAKLEMAIQKTHEHVRLLKRQRVLEDGYAAPDRAVDIIGGSAANQKLLETVARIAKTDSITLILGETGVGKELVATLLHTQSGRRDAPFVAVNCAALHDELFQSEVFGHEKGAFTGAHRLKHGLFEVANGGTIFLDEVGETSPESQAKLLRVLETGRFRRLGSSRETLVDVRVVAATNRDLTQATARGHFREDLYYRLATFTVTIPPLRARPEDVPDLVEHFIGRFNRRFSCSKRVDEAAMEILQRHTWPGNVRELIHVIEQSVVLCDGDVIRVEDLPVGIRPTGDDQTPQVSGDEIPSLREVQRRHIQWVLEKMAGNRAKAAHALRMSERTFYRLLERHRGSTPVPGGPADRHANREP